MVRILCKAGAKLETLVLDQCVELGDDTFRCIIHSCPNLQHLSLGMLDRITDDVVVQGFHSWHANLGLTTLDLTRCVGIKDAGVQAILAHSGASLETLSLNSLDYLTRDTFKLFVDEESNVGGELVELDVGFVRCVNDDVILGLSRCCKVLRSLKVWTWSVEVLMIGVWG